MPVCSKCHEDKPLDAFIKNRSHAKGHNPACKDCDVSNLYKQQFAERGGPIQELKRCARCTLMKDWTEFRTNPRNKDGLDPYCQPCMLIKQSGYYHKNSARPKRQPEHVRFWSTVDTSGGMESCWPWQGFLNDEGYGHTHSGRRHIRAHQLAYELTYGDIPKGLQVLHTCNNPCCCNAFRHLYLGTQTDNMRQCAAEGRMPGSANRKANNPPQQRAQQQRFQRKAGKPTWQERFWEKVQRSEDTNVCWLWLAGLTDGYGTFHVSTTFVEHAHRTAYRLAFGDIPPDMQVMHTCDNRACVNKNHLVLGTKDDNLRDMIAKNRHPHSLTEEQVRYVRSMKGIMSGKKLAQELHVTRSAISQIWNNRTWKHLQ